MTASRGGPGGSRTSGSAGDARGDPDWERGATLHPAVWSGIQRFQVGEDGDGANLVAKADRAADPDYARAVRLFVAEEQNHARLLALLLAAGGTPTLSGHWSDTVFVRLRRLMGLRLELLVLMIAEVVALRYYRALRDGTDDALTSDVAARILADEQRHVPFHCERLHASLAELPRPARRPVMASWRLLLLAVSVVVATDHGPGLQPARPRTAGASSPTSWPPRARWSPRCSHPSAGPCGPNQTPNAHSNTKAESARRSPRGGTRR